MESNEELKEVNINSRTFYCFGDRIKTEDFDFNNILIDEKSYKSILVYISYKALFSSKLLRIRFDKVDGFIRVYDGIRYLESFGFEKCDTIAIDIL